MPENEPNLKLKRVELNIRINNLSSDALRAALSLIADAQDLEQAVAAGEKYQDLKPEISATIRARRRT